MKKLSALIVCKPVPKIFLKMDFLLNLGYTGLFIGSFLASTLIPLSSEILLTGMLLAGGDPWISFGLATVGNSMGSLTGYGLGYLGKWKWIEKDCG